MEGYATVGIGAWGTIFQVAADGAAHFGQLAAYLVVTTGVQVDLQQPVAVAVADDAIVEYGLLGAGHFAVVGSGGVVLGIAGEPVGECALGLRRLVGHDGPIGLVHLSGAEHLSEARQGLAGAGEQDESADGAVEPMYHSKEHIPGLVVAFLDVGLHLFGEGHVAGLVALYDFPCPFVNDDDVIVLV